MKMRVPASIAITAMAALALAGCQFVTPQQTAASYTPADGVNASAGAIKVRNVFLIDGTGDTASVIGVLSNSGQTEESVTLQWTGTAGTETRSLQVPAGGLLSMTTDPTKVNATVPGDASAVVLDGVNATPGGLFNLTFTASDGSANLQVPVLTGSFSQYATLVPTPTPTPTKTKKALMPTDSPTPTPTDTLAG